MKGRRQGDCCAYHVLCSEAKQLLAVVVANHGVLLALALQSQDNVQRYTGLDQGNLEKLAPEVDSDHGACAAGLAQRQQRQEAGHHVARAADVAVVVLPVNLTKDG